MVKVLGTTEKYRLGNAEWRQPVSVGPLASDDTEDAIAGGGDVAIDPRVNDNDPAGQGLTIIPPLVVTGSGSASIIQDGTQIIFTPDEVGETIIDYTIEDANGATDSATITVTVSAAPDPGDRSVTISIVDHDSTYPAPCPAYLEASVSGFDADLEALGLDPTTYPALREQGLLYEWHLDDPGSTFADHSGRLAAMPNWNDANVAFGPRIVKLYKNPGTYHPFCRVWYGFGPSDFVDSAPIEVIVADPDTVFAGNTLVVSTDGDFAGAPAGTQLTTTSLNAALYEQSGNRRVRFKAGQEWTCDTGSWPAEAKILVDTWGGTDRAIWDVSAVAAPGMGDPAIRYAGMQDIEIDGKWARPDSYTKTAHPSAGPGVGNWGLEGNPHFVFDNVHVHDIRNNGFAASHGKTGDTWLRRVTLHDTIIERWGEAATYGLYSYVAFLGTFCSSGNTLNQSYDAEGPAMRIERIGQRDTDIGWGYLCCTDVFESYWGSKNSVQPSYKIQGNAELDAKWTGDRMIAEGGLITNGGVGSTKAQRQRGLVDKIVFLSFAETGVPFSLENGGTTIRNAVGYFPNVDQAFKKNGTTINSIGGNLFSLLPVQNTSDTEPENVNAHYHIHSSSVLFWTDPAARGAPTSINGMVQGFDGDNNNFWPDTRFSNNLVLAPNYASWTDDAADVSETIGFTPEYLGQKVWNFNGGALDTQYATPADTVRKITPQGASLTADQGAGEIVAFDYIDLTKRGASPAKGAWPPAP